MNAQTFDIQAVHKRLYLMLTSAMLLNSFVFQVEFLMVPEDQLVITTWSLLKYVSKDWR